MSRHSLEVGLNDFCIRPMNEGVLVYKNICMPCHFPAKALRALYTALTFRTEVVLVFGVKHPDVY